MFGFGDDRAWWKDRRGEAGKKELQVHKVVSVPARLRWHPSASGCDVGFPRSGLGSKDGFVGEKTEVGKGGMLEWMSEGRWLGEGGLPCFHAQGTWWLVPDSAEAGLVWA